MPEIVIIGSQGYLGSAYQKVFPDALKYDIALGSKNISKREANKARLAIICVPTEPKADGSLDMSIIEDVVSWLDTPLILIKSALMPGTVDRLVHDTGKKIAVSVEFIGEGKYFQPPWKYPHPQDPLQHNVLVIGGDTFTANACAEILWSKMSPDINIHLVSAVEAEVTKLMENLWGAQKVSFANTMYDVCQSYGANYIKVLQAWGADGRVEKMHMRVVKNKRGWDSKCYNKDIPALAYAASIKGIEPYLLSGVMLANQKHLNT